MRLSFRAVLLLLPLALAIPSGLASEEAKSDKTAESWTIAVTAARTKDLSQANIQASDAFVRRIIAQLDQSRSRVRTGDEIAGYIATQRLTDSEKNGQAIQTLIDKRDQLLFRGLADWKYRTEMTAVEKDLNKARKTLDEGDAKERKVSERLPLKLSDGNLKGEVPAAPEAGKEKDWAKTAKVDGALVLDVSSWYDRLRVRLQLFSPYLNEPLYADQFAFSVQDLEAAADETALRLLCALAGSKLAELRFSVTGADVVIYLDGKRLDPSQYDRVLVSPGTVEVLTDSPDAENLREKVDVSGGEKATIYLEMLQVPTNVVRLTVLDGDGAALDGTDVWLGSLYQGSTPLDLTLPSGVSQSLKIIARDGREATVLVTPDHDAQVVVRLDALKFAVDKPVEKARKRFYGALGRFSVCLPLVILSQGIASNYEEGYSLIGSDELYTKKVAARITSYVIIGVTAIFLGEAVWKYFGYVNAANESAVKKVELSDGATPDARKARPDSTPPPQNPEDPKWQSPSSPTD